VGAVGASDAELFHPWNFSAGHPLPQDIPYGVPIDVERLGDLRLRCAGGGFAICKAEVDESAGKIPYVG
jgi:hypothetical protein